jgi:hypothetical protein
VPNNEPPYGSYTDDSAEGLISAVGRLAVGPAGARLAHAVKYLATDADVSPCGEYRYWLSRRLSMGERTVLFVGLNPSTADAAVDDPTIRRCVGFARSWGYDWLLMGNLYAYRSTDPKALYVVDDPVGPENQDALKWMAHRAEVIVAAWGKNRLTCYAHTLAGWILSLEHTRCLGRNKDGSPKHPLYLSRTSALSKP